MKSPNFFQLLIPETHKVLMKCGHNNISIHRNDHDGLGPDHPSCVICDCCEVVESPELKDRKARCTYYGKKVKEGMYNANACEICKPGKTCQCERESSLDLWFFKYQPNSEYDEFYCACQGAD